MVTVIDTEAPVVECQSGLSVVALPGECTADVNLVAPSYRENCSSVDVGYMVYGADNSNSGFISGSDLTYTFNIGFNRVEWIVEDEAGNVSTCWQNIIVTADEGAIVPDAGPDRSICAGDSLFIDQSSALDFVQLMWSSTGSGHFVDATLENPVYVPSQADILNGYVILSVIASSDCASAKDQMVLGISKPLVVQAGSDQLICENDQVQLNGSVLNEVASVEWHSLGDGTFSNSTITNPVYIPGSNDIESGEVRLIFTAYSSGACADATDTLIVSISRQPQVDAGADAWICESEEYTLAGASVAHAESVIWTTSGTGLFENASAINTVYKPSKADILNGSVVLSVTAYADSPCATVYDQMLLSISNHPSVDAGPDMSICFGDEVEISEASADNFSLVSWSTSGRGTLMDEHTLTPSYIPASDETGLVVFTLQVIGVGACSTDTVYDAMTVELHEELDVFAGDDQAIYINTSTLISAQVGNGSGSYFYAWEPSVLVEDASSRTTETANLSSSTMFTVLVTDAMTGCSARDTVMVTVEGSARNLLTFYSGFSPNHDGVNDTWYIDGIDKFPENEVIIYNRWGDKINEYRDYDNVNVVWDGTNRRGEVVSDGTYFYLVTIREGESFTGWIQIRSEN